MNPSNWSSRCALVFFIHNTIQISDSCPLFNLETIQSAGVLRAAVSTSSISSTFLCAKKLLCSPQIEGETEGTTEGEIEVETEVETEVGYGSCAWRWVSLRYCAVALYGDRCWPETWKEHVTKLEFGGLVVW